MPCLHRQINDVLKDVFGYSKCQDNLGQLLASEVSPIFVF